MTSISLNLFPLGFAIFNAIQVLTICSAMLYALHFKGIPGIFSTVFLRSIRFLGYCGILG
jgi:hypothetical protein